MIEYIRINNLSAGDILSTTIYDTKGTPLLKSGSVLSEKTISFLHSKGFKGIYIDKSVLSKNKKVYTREPIINDLTTIKILNILTNILNNKMIFDNAWDNNFTAARKQLEDYVDDIYKKYIELDNKNKLLFEMEDGRTNENWLEYHSFNTMQIAMAIAIRLKYPEQVVKGIGLGGLMHDIGKGKYPELINKKEISDADKKKLRTHPRIIFDVLTQLSGAYASTYCTYACWQSHELFDGTGYPMHISGNKVTSFGYIVGIASRFDNLVHITPFNDNPMTNNDALEMIMGSNLYPVEIIRALVDVISAYPIGTKIKLSNGEEALVIENNFKLPLRPVITIGLDTINLASDENYRSVTIV